MGISLFLAAISGEALLDFIIWLVVAGIIYFILTWALSKIGVPEPFNKVIHVVLILAVALFLINALLSLAGHPLIRW